MGGIGAISNNSYRNYTSYGNFASGKKINSAADGAAEKSIIEKMETQTRGYGAGSNNIAAGKDLLNVADGGLSGITDYLQRIRELAVRASNTATVTDAERSAMQAEVDQLKKGIDETAQNTMFNTKPLLDGTAEDMKLMTDSNGSNMGISVQKSTLDVLGIRDFDLTGDFNIQDIDDAIAMVDENRSNVGAQSNALDYAFDLNSIATINTTAAKSKLEDLDFPEAISEQKKKETLQTYELMMQKKKQEDEENRMRNILFA